MNKSYAVCIAITGTIILAACGNRGTLEPAEGSSLPPPVYGEAKAPTGEELLMP